MRIFEVKLDTSLPVHSLLLSVFLLLLYDCSNKFAQSVWCLLYTVCDYSRVVKVSGFMCDSWADNEVPNLWHQKFAHTQNRLDKLMAKMWNLFWRIDISTTMKRSWLHKQIAIMRNFLERPENRTATFVHWHDNRRKLGLTQRKHGTGAIKKCFCMNVFHNGTCTLKTFFFLTGTKHRHKN